MASFPCVPTPPANACSMRWLGHPLYYGTALGTGLSMQTLEVWSLKERPSNYSVYTTLHGSWLLMPAMMKLLVS